MRLARESPAAYRASAMLVHAARSEPPRKAARIRVAECCMALRPTVYVQPFACEPGLRGRRVRRYGPRVPCAATAVLEEPYAGYRAGQEGHFLHEGA